MEPIRTSPEYFINRNGEIFNSKLQKLKVRYNKDGYARIDIPSIFHGKRISRTIHLLVADQYLGGGKYRDPNTELEVNHKDGNKRNNCVDNLEIITRKENVNHSHDTGLCKFDMRIGAYDVLEKKYFEYRSLRECSRKLKLSMNYLRPRILMSKYHYIKDRYILSFDYISYYDYISTLNYPKVKIYVYCYKDKKHYVLNLYVQISILFSISYMQISRKMKKNPHISHYIGGYDFSLTEIKDLKDISPSEAYRDRRNEWLRLNANIKNVGLKRVGIESLKSKR